MFVPTPSDAQPGDVIRGKWIFEGAETLEAAAESARQAADRLQELHDAGWTLQAPIEDDYGFLVDPTGNAGEPDE